MRTAPDQWDDLGIDGADVLSLILTATAPGDWVDDAACRHAETETFYPPKGSHTVHDAAMAICATCPVIDDCRDWAMAGPPMHGIVAGMSAAERDAEQRRAAA